MLDTLTALSQELQGAISEAPACDWSAAPDLPECGAVARWIATLTCGCRHFCCDQHQGIVQRWVLLILIFRGPRDRTVCLECEGTIQPWIRWERI
jgi:hypothetical protein